MTLTEERLKHIDHILAGPMATAEWLWATAVELRAALDAERRDREREMALTQGAIVYGGELLAEVKELRVQVAALRERLDRGLPGVYRRSATYAAAIALLCDDYLDRSGALLGRVRAQSAVLTDADVERVTP